MTGNELRIVHQRFVLTFFLPAPLLAAALFAILMTDWPGKAHLRAVLILLILLVATALWVGATVFVFSYTNNHPKIVLSSSGFYVRGMTLGEIPWRFLLRTYFHDNKFAKNGKDALLEFVLDQAAEPLLCNGWVARSKRWIAEVIFGGQGLVVNTYGLSLGSHEIQRAINGYCQIDTGVGSARGLTTN